MKRFNELSEEEEERALNLYRKAIVIDAQEPAASPSRANVQYIQTLQKSGLTATVTLMYRGTAPGRSADLHMALTTTNDTYSTIKNNCKNILHVTEADDIRKAKREGKVGLILGTSRIPPIGDNLKLLNIFHKLGLRVSQLTWNFGNQVGDGCSERTNRGLSDFGIEVIEEMNRLGILIDLSHAGDATAMDTVEMSKDPAIFSHSNPRGVFDNRRNVPDEPIKALAEKGGVFGVTFASSSLGAGVQKSLEEITAEDVIDHIDYIVDLIGVDHVGFGSNFAHPIAKFHKWEYEAFPEMVPYAGLKPISLDRVSKLPNLARGLVARGYSDNEITKILGDNFLRVFEKVWK